MTRAMSLVTEDVGIKIGRISNLIFFKRDNVSNNCRLLD
jgi:hypothetical protein